VLLLRKALDGLKQAPREWGQELESKLRTQGFTKPVDDQAVYMKVDADDRTYLATWVDDLLIVAAATSSIAQVKAGLKQHFEIKDLGEAKLDPGVHILRNRAGRHTGSGTRQVHHSPGRKVQGRTEHSIEGAHSHGTRPAGPHQKGRVE